MISTFIDVDALSGKLDDPDFLIVDVRHQLADPSAGERLFRESHIPGAVFLHLDRDLSGPMTGRNGRHPLPSPDRLAECFGRIGIGANTQVVVYDDAGGMIAGRLWWSLRWMGHDAVALLDGGWQAWLAAGGVTTAVIKTRPGVAFAPRIQPQMLVNIEDVQDNLQRQDFLVLDAGLELARACVAHGTQLGWQKSA